MTIQLTITDTVDTETYNVLIVPVTASPIINERDVQTLDGNISTYYTSTKRSFTFNLGYLTSGQYAQLKAFRDRQYTNLKYPTITIAGEDTIQVTNMPAKMMLSDQNIICECGDVQDVQVSFRESKQI